MVKEIRVFKALQALDAEAGSRIPEPVLDDS
jgi:hypothetical protein